MIEFNRCSAARPHLVDHIHIAGTTESKMKFVKLNMVVGHEAAAAPVEQINGEDDGLADSNIVSLPAAAPAPVEITSPVMVDIDKVRAFYPRKKDRHGRDRAGTRLTFDNGSGMAVTDSFNDVAAAIR